MADAAPTIQQQASSHVTLVGWKVLDRVLLWSVPKPMQEEAPEDDCQVCGVSCLINTNLVASRCEEFLPLVLGASLTRKRWIICAVRPCVGQVCPACRDGSGRCVSMLPPIINANGAVVVVGRLLLLLPKGLLRAPWVGDIES